MNKFQREFMEQKISQLSLSDKFDEARNMALNANCEVPTEMYEIDCLCEGMTPLEIIREYGDLDIDCSYFMHDGYGYVSMDDAKLEEWCNEMYDEFLRYKDPDDFDSWDDEEYGEWLVENHPDDLYDAISLDDDFPYSADGETRAIQFAKRWGVGLETFALGYKKHFPNSEKKYHVFNCKLTNKDGEEYEFEFGNDGSSEPTMYDILAGLTKSNPATYEDFCDEYSYDGREGTLEVYNNAKKEWEAVLRLFGPENGKCFEELCEIC